MQQRGFAMLKGKKASVGYRAFSDDGVGALVEEVDPEAAIPPRAIDSPLSRLKLALLFLKSGFTVVASFTLSGMVVALPFLLENIEPDPGSELHPTSVQRASAINVIVPTKYIVVSLTAMLNAGNVLAGSLFANDHHPATADKIARLFRNLYLMGLPLAGIISAALYESGEYLNQSEVVTSLINAFLPRLAISAPFLVARMVAQQMYFAKREFAFVTKVSWLGLVAAALTIVGSSVWPGKQGWAGIANGFIVDSAVIAFLLNLGLFIKKDFKHIPFARAFVQGYQNFGKEFWEFSKIALNIFLQSMGSLAAGFATSILLPSLLNDATEAEAALNSSTQFTFVTTLFNLAFALTAMSLVAGMKGNSQFISASRLARLAPFLGMAVISPVCLFAALFPKVWTRMLSPNIPLPILNRAEILVPMIAAAEMVKMPINIMTQILRQTDDNHWPTWLATSFLALGVGAAYIFGNSDIIVSEGFGIEGIVAASSLALIPSALLLGLGWWKRTTAENFETVQANVSESRGLVSSCRSYARRCCCSFFSSAERTPSEELNLVGADERPAFYNGGSLK